MVVFVGGDPRARSDRQQGESRGEGEPELDRRAAPSHPLELCATETNTQSSRTISNEDRGDTASRLRPTYCTRYPAPLALSRCRRRAYYSATSQRRHHQPHLLHQVIPVACETTVAHCAQRSRVAVPVWWPDLHYAPPATISRHIYHRGSERGSYGRTRCLHA